MEAKKGDKYTSMRFSKGTRVEKKKREKRDLAIAAEQKNFPYTILLNLNTCILIYIFDR